MSKEKLGQSPAFGYAHIDPGMDKRFYVACAAMQGLLSNPHPNLMTTNHEDIVRLSYIFADEMLKQEKL